jgi:hypothetical protein
MNTKLNDWMGFDPFLLCLSKLGKASLGVSALKAERDA